MKIHVSRDSLARLASGLTSGEIWLEGQGVALPDAGCVDTLEFALVGLLREGFSLAAGQRGTARIRFMERSGPLELEAGDDVTFRYGDQAFTATRSELARAMLTATREVHAGYQARNWDADELGRYVKALEGIVDA